MQSLRQMLIQLTLIAGVGLLSLLLVARIGTWPTPWPLPLLDTIALYAFAPFVAVAVVGLLLRSKMLVGISLAALVFFGQQFGPQVASAFGLHNRTMVAATDSRITIRLLTLNVHAPYDDPSAIVGLIRAHRPDLIVLQEMTTAYAAALQPEVGDDFPYSFMAGIETEHEGAGTWSRLPLVGSEAFSLRETSNLLHRVRVAAPGGDLWVYNVHLSNPTDPISDHEDRGRLGSLLAFDERPRDAELDGLIRRVGDLDGPFVLAGDFNLSAGSRAYRRLPPSWRDAFDETGQGFGHTYPTPDHAEDGVEPGLLRNWIPLLRIDYVLTSSDIQPVRAWTEQMTESDHLAMIADLALAPTD